MALQFKRATREQVKVKLGVTGPSGSGKTKGALALARQLVGPEGRIAFVDTENDSGSLYADFTEFDTISLTAPYTSAKYTEAIKAAVEERYDVIVIDSLSHQWEGSGGILDRKTLEERRGNTNGGSVNGYTLWAKYKEEHRAFVAGMLAAPIHVIGCMRSRQEYVQGERNGKKTVEKLGMAPITGEGMEFEFSVVFDLNMQHMATATKDRTDLFDGQLIDLLFDNPGERILEWLKSGAPAKPKPTREPTTKPTLAVARSFAIERPGKPTVLLGEFNGAQLVQVRDWAVKRDRFDIIDCVDVIIAHNLAVEDEAQHAQELSVEEEHGSLDDTAPASIDSDATMDAEHDAATEEEAVA